MKKNLLSIVATTLIVLFILFFLKSKTTSFQNQQQTNRFNCLADDCLAVNDLEYPVEKLSDEISETLDKAINDEYKAFNTYQAVLAKFGPTRPFSMIIGAEEQHIAALKTIYTKYGLQAPKNISTKVNVPNTLSEACKIGVDAEIANVKLYKEELLPKVLNYPDITNVFNNLMNASEQKHLPAFQRCI